MSEMVERVAAIIAANHCTGYETPCTRDPKCCNCISVARAAIEAMRVPTEAMVTHGTSSITGGRVPDADYIDDVRNIWRAMIDEALKPDGGVP